jgi:hypothetical protein
MGILVDAASVTRVYLGTLVLAILVAIPPGVSAARTRTSPLLRAE